MITKAEITLVRSLADKKSREEHGFFVAEGAKIVGEAAASGLTVRKIYALEKAAADFPEAVHASPKEMERLSRLKTPSDVVALIEIPRREIPGDIGRELTLALDDIQDPGNMGTIIRLADWFGIENIVCSPATADCFSPKVVQATMGAVLRVKVHYTPLEEFLAGMRRRDIPVYGAFLDGENIYEAKLTQGGILLMGNEGNGISHAIEAHVSRRLFIPPYPAGRSGSESLNVATATAILCSEFRRRK